MANDSNLSAHIQTMSDKYKIKFNVHTGLFLFCYTLDEYYNTTLQDMWPSSH